MSNKLPLFAFLAVLLCLFLIGCEPSGTGGISKPFDGSTDACYDALKGLADFDSSDRGERNCAVDALASWMSCRGSYPCLCAFQLSENETCWPQYDAVLLACGCDGHDAAAYLDQEGYAVGEVINIVSVTYITGLV